jgi:hypothetical protein
MPTYEVIYAPVREPANEETCVLEAANPGDLLIKNVSLHPDTFVKSWREVPAQPQ